MKRILILCLLNVTLYSQTINLKLINRFHKKQNFLFYKTHIFKFTASSNINAKYANKFISNENFGSLASSLKYEFRTKFYLTDKVSFLIKSQITSASNIASFGIVYKFRK